MVNIKKNQYDTNNKRHGKWIYHYSNGQLELSCNYVHGVLHGLDEGYFFSGKLRYRGRYNMGREIGFWYSLIQKNIIYV